MRDDTRKHVSEIFRVYNEILRKAAALDFDDLLLRTVELLRDHADVRAAWSARFQYLMVDEFQDTNGAQEELVRLLAGTRKNVCVVGDEDQSIYGWRGARAGNLKRFTEDFPNARIIRLEENYRSTQTILDAAAAVVQNNSGSPRQEPSGDARLGRASALFRSAGLDGGGRFHLRRDFVDRAQRSGCSRRRALSHGRAIAIV